MSIRIKQKMLEYSNILNAVFEKYFNSGSNIELYEATNYLLRAGGKRIRPLLMLIISESISGQYNHVLLASIAIELFHTFTLIHDDIMDHSKLRRNVKAVHEMWSEPKAILAGDALYLESINLLSKYNEYYKKEIVRSDIIIKIINSLVVSGIEICEGQWLDLSYEKNKNITEDQYMSMIKKKTAVLFGAVAKISGLLNNIHDEDSLNKLYNFGFFLGVAFQLQDDILDIIGNPNKTGKDQYSDIKEGKMTLIIIHALKKKSILDGFGCKNITKNQIDKIINEFDNCGSLNYVKNLSNEYITRSKNELNSLNFPIKTKFLTEFLEYIAYRC